MSSRRSILAGIILISLTLLTGCGGSGSSKTAQTSVASTGGDLNLDTMTPTRGNGFIAVSTGNLFSATGSIHIDTSSTTGDGGNVVLVAGASSAQAAQSTTISGRSGAGGDVNLGNLNAVTIDTRSFAPGHSGGSVTIVAYAQSPGSATGGHISLPPGLTILTGGTGVGQSGQITLIGEARSSRAWPVTVQTGALNTTGSQNAAMVVIETATPASDVGPVTITGGSASQPQPTGGTALSGIFHFGAIQEGAVKTGAMTAANGGGSVLVLAGSNAATGPAISTQDITTSGSSSSGRVLLMAGATLPQTRVNGFDIGTGNIDAHSTSTQPGFPVTLVTPGAIKSGSINTSCTSTAANSGGSGEVTMVAGSYYKPGAGITVSGGINSSVQSTYSLGAATVTLIGLGTGSDISVINPDGPAVNTATTGQTGGGAGALLIATPGTITLDNNSLSGDAVNTSGGPTLSGSQVFLSSGATSGPAIKILAHGVNGNIDTSGGQLGYGNVWVLTAGGTCTDFTTVGDPAPNKFIMPSAGSAAIKGPLSLTFKPGSVPTGYCPGGYTSISDDPTQATTLTIDSTGNKEPLEVPVLVTGRTGIGLNNPGSFIATTYSTKPPQAVMKLFSAGPISAPVTNGHSGQLFAITGLVSTTGDITVSSALSPVSMYNTVATPGTLSVNSAAPQPPAGGAPGAITDYGALVAGNSINISSTGNANVALSPAPPALATVWEYLCLAHSINVSADGSGSIASSGQLYCARLALKSGSGSISVTAPADLSVEAGAVQVSTSGTVSVTNNWPAISKPGNDSLGTEATHASPP